MKFAELSVKAGFPPGVINVLPGKGTVSYQSNPKRLEPEDIKITVLQKYA